MSDVRTEVVAILVDGGFYLQRAHVLFGEKSPEERAKELVEYCSRHLEKIRDAKTTCIASSIMIALQLQPKYGIHTCVLPSFDGGIF